MSQLKIVSDARKLVAFAALLSAGIVAFAGSAHATNLLVNGNFDTEVPDNSTGGGWTSTTIASGGGYGWNSGRGNPVPGYILNHNGYQASDPSISQAVSDLIPGRQYLIAGEYALGLANGAPEGSFEVRINGSPILTIGPHPDHLEGYTPYRGFSVTFTATATSHVVMFAAECNGSDHHYIVDNLSMELVPESPIAVEASTWGKVKALYRR